MRRLSLMLVVLFACGCGGKGCGGGSLWDKAKNSVGFGPTPEEVRAEEERVRAERETAAQRLKDADYLVQKWADRLAESGLAHEGLTDEDPWGNQIQITYHQEWFKRFATVRSAGPDGQYNTADDLTRVRSCTNISGILGGISGWGWVAIVWVMCGVLAFAASTGVSHRRTTYGKSGEYRHPILFFVVTVLFAPLMALVYGFAYFGGALAGTAGGFDMDFNFEIDLD